MADLAQLEVAFQEYTQDLGRWVPDGILPVNLSLLHRLDLLDFSDDNDPNSSKITHYFHVVESPEKITLFNDHFAVWIIPEISDGRPVTYGLIAFNYQDDVQLELAFSATGIYNTSRMVLRVLEELLHEIQETEEELTNIS